MKYVDTSVLVAYYCPERLSDDAEHALRREAGPCVSDLCEVEFFSALGRKTRRGELLQDDARRIASTFVAHLDAGLYTRVALERRHYLVARDWLATLSVPLRSLDALHLAVAASADIVLLTADRTLASAAETLGVNASLVARTAN